MFPLKFSNGVAIVHGIRNEISCISLNAASLLAQSNEKTIKNHGGGIFTLMLDPVGYLLLAYASTLL